MPSAFYIMIKMGWTPACRQTGPKPKCPEGHFAPPPAVIYHSVCVEQIIEYNAIRRCEK